MRFLERRNGFFVGLAKESFGLVLELYRETANAALGISRNSFALGGCAQVFFLSILRFRTISLRESKLETVRVADFAPSFSACNS